jgi:hypothetical protein
VFCSLIRETVSPHTPIYKEESKNERDALPLCHDVVLGCSSTVLGMGSEVVAARGRETSVQALWSWRLEATGGLRLEDG